MKTIVALINTYAEMEATYPDLSIEDFCVKYLAERVQIPSQDEDTINIPMNGQLGALIGKLNSFAGLYCKKAMQNVGLNNIDDWAYLITLSQMDYPKKSELIYEMVSEFPSGIDIIKRLVALNLVEEQADEDDRRSKRLKITENGLAVLAKSMPYMYRVGEMAFGTLQDNEKTMIVNVLKRLDVFHTGHYKDIRTAEFEEAFALLTNH
jgi:MarR family transcriptional regulator, lower aerobic nicotinate degradation pathway regulator